MRSRSLVTTYGKPWVSYSSGGSNFLFCSLRTARNRDESRSHIRNCRFMKAKLTFSVDPKKGEKCHRMLDCGHVFCIQCLQDFYNNAIKEGDLVAVRCLEPSCAKKREDALKSGSKRVKAKTFISPSELLQIPLEPEVVKRYVTLKYKMELESDKNTIYCPRTWCQGAARSKKHKKPEGFELHEAEDSDIEDDQLDTAATKPAGPKKKPLRPEAVLAVCEDCNFAFCSGCHQSWHGEFYTCSLKRRNSNDLAKEEKASLEFLGLHTTPCPSCGSASQKTEGCNHMYVLSLSCLFPACLTGIIGSAPAAEHIFATFARPGWIHLILTNTSTSLPMDRPLLVICGCGTCRTATRLAATVSRVVVRHKLNSLLGRKIWKQE